MELIIEPAQFLIDALQEKTLDELLSIIQQSAHCDKISTISIHMVALDILARQYPYAYEKFEQTLNFPYGVPAELD
ncbi:MAG: hypothetical protein JSS76_08485 [Bacteroidetes bacterium]|nr:hypothetical protein [Bacteroidota bacterium]